MDPALVFFYYPRACSLAVHIALEETGVPYERRLVDLKSKKNRSAEYLALNPKGSVPALSIDGRVLTETHALLTFLGDLKPQLGLLPPTGDFARYRAHEWMNFLSSSVHVYIRSVFRSSAYAGDNPQAAAAVNAQGVRNLAGAVAVLEDKLGDRPWALGDRYSVVDAYLFVMYLWSTDERIASVPPRPNWDRVAAHVWSRPATRRVVEVERRDRNYPVPAHWSTP
ncbi:MAG TPA: glutathione S-transferase N-terminal domain-containing protein [Nevskiaceae bacterium]